MESRTTCHDALLGITGIVSISFHTDCKMELARTTLSRKTLSRNKLILPDKNNKKADR